MAAVRHQLAEAISLVVVRTGREQAADASWLAWLLQAGYPPRFGSLDRGWHDGRAADLVLLHVVRVDASALRDRKRCERIWPGSRVALVTEEWTPLVALRAMRQGAWDCLQARDRTALLAACRRACRECEKDAQSRAKSPVGVQEPGTRLRPSERNHFLVAPPLEEQAQLRRYAPGLGPLVLLGGPGTEKQDWAHWMHLHSECRSGPFLPLVQPALDPHRLAQELCGSFAVPSHPHTGKMSWAATVFLPDLQQCPLAVQGHLAAMLSNALSGRPLGDHRLRAKLVVGISTSPVHAVQRGTVHPALLPWLHQVVELAPLRDRIWQLPALVQHCLQEVARLQGGLTPQVSQACWRRLQAYAWPGNVDELRQVIRAACAQARSRRIEEGDLPESVHGENEPNPSVSLAEAEERLLLQTLASHRGNKTATAAALGISRRGLYKKLRRLKQGVESATLPLRQNR